MQRGKVLWIAGGVALVVLVAGLGLFAWRRHEDSGRDDEARRAALALVTAWQGGHFDQLSWDGTDGASMQSEYAALAAGMGKVRPAVHLAGVERTGSRASATVDTSWSLPGGRNWSYRTAVTIDERDGHWLVDPDGVSGASIFAPIPRDSRLTLSHTQQARGEITGKGGTRIVGTGPVVDVGIEPARVTDPNALVQQVARITGVDRAGLAKALAAAPSEHAFVPVITLRQADYDKVKDRLQPLHGAVFQAREQSLAVNRDFARALIGTVGPVTAEIVSGSESRYTAGDFAGVSGLQRQYDAQLAGTSTYTVSEVPKVGATADSAQVLFKSEGTPGQPLATTLDPKVQVAADQALARLRVPGALVALDVRSGAVLAVANTPSTGLNRAMVGRYPPGSTLKVATTLALLEGGLRTTAHVNCPATATVGGRTFRNFEHEQLGSVPFSTDFKNSCNTAFVGLSTRLKADDLHTAALQLGLGGDWAAGLGAGSQSFAGSIPTTTGAVDQAAAAFGQGRNLVSPLSMAVLAGSVARGKFVAPTLVTSPASPASAAGSGTPAGPPAAQDIATLHALMRLVVTSGTAAGQFTGVPGGPIFAKTGTAEFGSASPPQTHAWLIGWQGNVAFAAFVEQGKSGGGVAGPVARDFLTRLHRG